MESAFIQLILGADTGPFCLYSDTDLYVTPFECGVTNAQISAGYITTLVPDGTTILRVQSYGVCTTYIDVILMAPTPTPTPTMTPTKTPTPTPSVTPTNTPTNTPTVTPSSVTPTPTPSLPPSTPTPTPSFTPTNTMTPTVTPTSVTPTPTPTITHTPTPSSVPRGFITEWTVNPSYPNYNKVILPLYNSGTFNCTVNWGDGSPLTTITSYNDTGRTHTYISGGTYNVEIKGECPGWSFTYLSGLVTRNTDSNSNRFITDIIYWGDSSVFGGFQALPSAFRNAYVKTTGTGKILVKNGLNSIGGIQSPGPIFDNCIYLTTINSQLFDNCTGATSFQGAFRSTLITSIPNGLFNKCTLVTRFDSAFRYCDLLTTIGSGIFDNCTIATNFESVFESSIINGLPNAIFDSCTGATNFRRAFYNCIYVETLPDYLFDNCVSITNFYQTFAGCIRLKSLPDYLFGNNSNAVVFLQTFAGCYALQMNPTIFGDYAQYNRFYNLPSTVYFAGFFDIGSAFTGLQGTAQDLWNFNYGTTVVFLGDVSNNPPFYGNSLLTLSNYNDIPTAWKDR